MTRFTIPRVLLAVTLSLIPDIAVPQDILDKQEAAQTCQTEHPMAANALQVASQIGILPMVHRARELASGCNLTAVSPLEELTLHQRITEAVLTASLDVDGVLAEIDYEQAQITELREALTSRRDRKINLLSVANIVASTGTGIVGTAMQFSDRTATAGDAVGVAGGAGGVILSIMGLQQQGTTGLLGVAPNMLAPIFQRRAELRSVYPEDVWAYLNSTPATDPRIHVPWKDELIAEWVRLGRIGPPTAPGSQKKIDLLASRIAEHRQLSINLLTDRSAMLADLRARVSLMNRDLRDLMREIAVR